MLSAPELLTARFYAWEQRGRGWCLFEHPVEIEPEYYPFVGHYLTRKPTFDDTGKATIFSGLKKLLTGTGQNDTKESEIDIPEVGAYTAFEEYELSVFSITLPKAQKVEADDMGQLLLMVSSTRHLISFEIIATHLKISVQIVCAKEDALYVQSQIKAYYPTAVFKDLKEEGLNILSEGLVTTLVDYGLSAEFMRPIKMSDKFNPDPYIGLFAPLENIQENERAVIQILFKGTGKPWAESIMRSASDGGGGSFFADAPDMLQYAKEKVSTPLFAVCIRASAQAATHERAEIVLKDIHTALVQTTGSKSNSLIPLSTEGQSLDDFYDNVLLRKTQRLGMLLNIRELSTLVHFPSPDVTSSKVERDAKKTKPAPDITEGHELVLGINHHQGREKVVTVETNHRLRHTHLIGATGTGKSTLLLSMIEQDMKNGNGIAVLDPHGDLIENILGHVPEHRIKDVIVIDPADSEYPVGFNILSAHSEIEKDILSSDLVAVFKRLSTSWGDQMNSVFANAILAFLESKQGGTLVDLRRFLVEKEFRNAYLKEMSDSNVVYYWQHEFPLIKSGSIGPILTRLDTFLRPKLIRNMVAQKKSLDFENILDTQKILLIKLSQGLIGAENSYLLGTFFVSKMYQAAMARQAKSKETRKDFFLFIDEFQNFITPSMSYILSGARKYHLGLILAHQDMTQLQRYDSELASAVTVNAGTRICFRLGDTDAKRFASGFSFFEAEDLENLRTGEAIVRIEQPAYDFNVETVPLDEVSKEDFEKRTTDVIQHSRDRYSSTLTHEEPQTIYTKIEKQEIPLKTKPIADVVENVIAKVKPVINRDVQPPSTTPKQESQHKYLQKLIKKMAESRGYVATEEVLTPDGKGRVDVALERAGKRIAVEVSVTTTKEWELHNVQKCLSAGYDIVIVCSNDRKTVGGIQAKVQKEVSETEQQKILAFEPSDLFKYLDAEVVKESTTEKTVKGYRVTVEYSTHSIEEMMLKQKNVVKTVVKTIKKTTK